MKKTLEELDTDDFDQHGVWKFAKAEDGSGDLDMDHVESIRAEAVVKQSDIEVMVLITCKLADNTELLGIASVDGSPPEMYPGISIKFKGEWFAPMFPPAPPFVLKTQGPSSLSKFLGKPIEKIFPMRIETQTIFLETNKSLTRTLTENGKQIV